MDYYITSESVYGCEASRILKMPKHLDYSWYPACQAGY
jgi:hypothetical protein